MTIPGGSLAFLNHQQYDCNLGIAWVGNDPLLAFLNGKRPSFWSWKIPSIDMIAASYIRMGWYSYYIIFIYAYSKSISIVYIYTHIYMYIFIHISSYLYKQTFPMIGEYCWLHTFNPISGWIFVPSSQEDHCRYFTYQILEALYLGWSWGIVTWPRQWKVNLTASHSTFEKQIRRFLMELGLSWQLTEHHVLFRDKFRGWKIHFRLLSGTAQRGNQED